MDILFRGIDALEQYLESIQTDGTEGSEDNQDIIDDLNALISAGNGADAPAQEGAAPKEAEKPEVQEGDKRKFLNIPITEYEISALNNAKEEGKNIFGITVYLQETCILKAARAFLVFKSIENKGELVKSVPSVEEIEDEEFDFDFSWILVSSDTK